VVVRDGDRRLVGARRRKAVAEGWRAAIARGWQAVFVGEGGRRRSQKTVA